MPAKTFDELKGDLSRTYPALSPQLQRIASYALEHPQHMALETVASLAQSANVQPSAMVRFAQALGYDGFSALQRVFRGRLVERSNRAPGLHNYRERIAALRPARSGPGGVLSHFVADAIASLDRLPELVSRADLAAAVRTIAAARTIYTLGHRRSFTVAYYLSYGLTQLDLNAHLLDSMGGMLRDKAELIGAKDALIVMSFKNYTAEVVEVAAACHARKVPVIAITDNALSPLVPHAAVCFQIEEKGALPFGMLAGPVCFAQALVIAVGEQLEK
ncbi:MAG TPA: MurR/RpiR family transcriptional regulator [Burkholderiales bacterium]|nr:MurR/RpiR family transcriptional regulator [Burkholderiales bacterium]